MLLEFFKKKLNDRLQRELWTKVYIESLSQGNEKDYCRVMADNAVSAYNNKFVQVKINLK